MAIAAISILSSMATKGVLEELAPAFERATGVKVIAESIGGVDVNKRVKAGEAVDLVVLAANAIDTLINEGHLVAGSRVDLVTSGVAVAVRAGALRPAIGSEAAVKAAVLAAKTVSYSTGPSGVYLAKLFERWGILDEIKARIVVAPPGVPVGGLVARGEAELGFQQMSELIHLPGIDVIGVMPPAIQTITTFSAGIAVASKADAAAVRTFLDYARSPAAADAIRGNGMEAA